MPTDGYYTPIFGFNFLKYSLGTAVRFCYFTKRV